MDTTQVKYVIVDLECTCWKHNDPNSDEHETIEIGAVFLDEDYVKIGELDIFVHPINNPILSDFCTDLTGIRQTDIDEKGVRLSEAIEELERSLPPDRKVVFCSWGGFDERQLRKECEDNGLQYPFVEDDHVNIKTEYMQKMKRTKGGLQKACRVLHLRFNGAPHSGIDDANMTAEVFRILRKEK